MSSATKSELFEASFQSEFGTFEAFFRANTNREEQMVSTAAPDTSISTISGFSILVFVSYSKLQFCVLCFCAFVHMCFCTFALYM